jgi:hypothetical protein
MLAKTMGQTSSGSSMTGCANPDAAARFVIFHPPSVELHPHHSIRSCYDRLSALPDARLASQTSSGVALSSFPVESGNG